MRANWLTETKENAVWPRAAPVAQRDWTAGGGCLYTNFENRLAVLVSAAEVVDEHLFYRLVVGHEDVADGASADEVADFFG